MYFQWLKMQSMLLILIHSIMSNNILELWKHGTGLDNILRQHGLTKQKKCLKDGGSFLEYTSQHQATNFSEDIRIHRRISRSPGKTQLSIHWSPCVSSTHSWWSLDIWALAVLNSLSSKNTVILLNIIDKSSGLIKDLIILLICFKYFCILAVII